MVRDESTPSEVVETADGRVRGREVSGVRVYRGIPYGASTAGVNRFRPPQPPVPWSGERDADWYGETAPQADTWLAKGGVSGRRPPIGEDCLVLNVWTPAPDTAARPVMVWLHGGGFEAGTGSMMLYDGVNMARRGDVVVVTINHRLGLTGHLHLADAAGEDFAGSANVGFLDIVAALEWVRTNIAGFGGDPANVTIYGQSGGGRKVSLATASTRAQGLFHRGIVQSGSHLRLMSPERADEMADRLLTHLEIPRHQARRLQEIPLADLMAAARAARCRVAPTVDGVVFDRHPWDPDAPATATQVPMMIGTCRTELSNQLGSIDPSTFDIVDADLPERLSRFVDPADVPEAVEIVRRTSPDATAPEVLFTVATARGYWRDSILQTERKAATAAAGGAAVWSYRLMWRTPVEGGRRVTPHSLDLPFMFDNVHEAEHMVGPPTDETAAMANAMSESWLAFARTGDPNCPAVPDWRPYDLDRRTVMHFDVPPCVVEDPHHDERVFMERYPTQQESRRGILHR
ncbi:MAG: carboxylesterase/lipase family protein [Acidimicrobiales bacterium]